MTLKEVLVTEESTTIDSVVTLINSLKQQVADFLFGTNIPPNVQTQIDAIFDAATVNKGKLDTALSTSV